MKSILKTKYYKKKTTVVASALGDLAVLLIPVMIATVEGAPNLPHSVQYWTMQIMSIVLVILKFASKFWKEPDTTEDFNTQDHEINNRSNG